MNNATTRCIHGCAMPCAQCVENRRWNLAGGYARLANDGWDENGGYREPQAPILQSLRANLQAQRRATEQYLQQLYDIARRIAALDANVKARAEQMRDGRRA